MTARLHHATRNAAPDGDRATSDTTELSLDPARPLGYRPRSNNFTNSDTRRKTQMSSAPQRARDDASANLALLPQQASFSSRVLPFVSPHRSEAMQLLEQIEAEAHGSIPYLISIMARLLSRARVHE